MLVVHREAVMIRPGVAREQLLGLSAAAAARRPRSRRRLRPSASLTVTASARASTIWPRCLLGGERLAREARVLEREREPAGVGPRRTTGRFPKGTPRPTAPSCARQRAERPPAGPQRDDDGRPRPQRPQRPLVARRGGRRGDRSARSPSRAGSGRWPSPPPRLRAAAAGIGRRRRIAASASGGTPGPTRTPSRRCSPPSIASTIATSPMPGTSRSSTASIELLGPVARPRRVGEAHAAGRSARARSPSRRARARPRPRRRRRAGRAAAGSPRRGIGRRGDHRLAEHDRERDQRDHRRVAPPPVSETTSGGSTSSAEMSTAPPVTASSAPRRARPRAPPASTTENGEAASTERTLQSRHPAPVGSGRGDRRRRGHRRTAAGPPTG